jgi:hypothetical protein
MYSLFSGAHANYSLKENVHKMGLTAKQATFLHLKQAFSRVNRNFESYQGYHKALKHEISLDKLLFEEYLSARKKGKGQFVQAYETWKANSLLADEYLYITTIRKYDKPLNLESFFTEGKAQSNDMPKFLKELIGDFTIFVAFFLKFLKRMSDE